MKLQYSLIHKPGQNRLLAALQPDELERLPACLQLVPLALGQRLYRPGEKMQYACFPTTAIVSLNYVTTTGAAAETAGVGNDGMVGVPLFLGGDSLPGSAVVQTGGHAFRLEERHLKQEFQRACHINSRRGHISIINRAGLEAIACECYGVISGETGKL